MRGISKTKNHRPVSRSFPFRDGGGPRTKFGELAVADGEANDARRRVFLGGLVGYVPTVGVPGRDVLIRDGGEPVDGDSPEAASVRRNSTHKREKDLVQKVNQSNMQIF
jgi:hypothetical protein